MILTSDELSLTAVSLGISSNFHSNILLFIKKILLSPLVYFTLLFRTKHCTKIVEIHSYSKKEMFDCSQTYGFEKNPYRMVGCKTHKHGEKILKYQSVHIKKNKKLVHTLK